MGVKNIVKSAGEGTVKGVKSVGKGILVIGNTVYSSTFIVAQITGLVMMVAGIIIICIMAGKKFGLTNLKPLFTMITGVVIAIVGIIMVGTSYGIRWKHRMVNRVTEIEKKWGPARKTNSSLKRAYNINRSSKRRAVRSSQSE
ncbi:MAG: hypothetical protein IJJ95_03475 [Spirochaetales bacterium]|nr:hypothetical protein [Spirochaetales bacterium]